MDHIKVIKRAFQITWKYRTLWLVGLLLVLVGGGVASVPSSPPSNPGRGADSDGSGSYGDWGYHRDFDNFDEAWEAIGPWIVGAGAIIAAVVVVAMLFGVVRVALRYVTRGSLIRMVDRYEETGEEVKFGAAFRLGWNRSAWRMLLISLILKLPVVLFGFALTIPPIGLAIWSFVGGTGPRIVLGIVLLLLIIPASLLTAVLSAVVRPFIQVAYRECTLNDLGAWDSVKAAFGLVRQNVGPVALQWLLLVGLGIAWQIALFPVNLVLFFLGLMVAGIPATILGGLGALLTSWGPGVAVGVLTFVPVFLVVVVLPNVLFNTLATVFHSTVWTLTYREVQAIDAEVEAIDAEVEETEWSEPVKTDTE